MSRRAALPATIAAVALAALVGLAFPPLEALLLVGLLFASRRSPSLSTFWLRQRSISRTLTGLTAVTLLGGGVACWAVVPGDASDNAWLGLLAPAAWLVAMSIPFAVASLLPERWWRRDLVAASLTLLLAGGLGLAIGLSIWAGFADEHDSSGLELRFRIGTGLAFFSTTVGAALMPYFLTRLRSGQASGPPQADGSHLPIPRA